MTILGKFTKQPLEVEVYSIQFRDDISSQDEIVSANVAIYERDTITEKLQTSSVPYAKSGQLIRSSAEEFYLPEGVVGDFVSAVNVDQFESMVVQTSMLVQGDGDPYLINGQTVYTMPSKSSVLFAKSSTNWDIEAMAWGLIVSNGSDQRIRTFVSGGLDGKTYIVEVTVVTKEGRSLQNEFVVKVKDF